MTFVDRWFEYRVLTSGDSDALVTPSEVVSWRSLYQRSGLVASALVDRDIGNGDRIAIDIQPGAEFVCSLFGCLLVGGIAVPIDQRLTNRERREQLQPTKTTIDPKFVDQCSLIGLKLGDRSKSLNHLKSQTKKTISSAPYEFVSSPLDPSSLQQDSAFFPQDPALIVHSSGTTSRSRPVELTLTNLFTSAIASSSVMKLSVLDRWLCPMPLTHVGGIMILMRSLVSGCSTVFSSSKFDAECVNNILAEQKVTIISVVPTMFSRMLDAGLKKLPNLRCVLVGGAPIEFDLIKRAADAGIPIARTYGLTEACSQVTLSPFTESELVVPKACKCQAKSAKSSPKKTVTAGQPLPKVEVEIAEDGEILVKGSTVAPGEVSPDGFLHTGDLGKFVHGQLVVTGRKSTMIISGGENVSPVEVEEVLTEHPKVSEAAVFAKSDSDWGQAIAAKVVLHPNSLTKRGESATILEELELRTFCKSRLAGYKVPKEVKIVQTLPRTTTGKVARWKLT